MNQKTAVNLWIVDPLELLSWLRRKLIHLPEADFKNIVADIYLLANDRKMKKTVHIDAM